ncbi:hypothetical protein M8C21_026456 [Ambrosia artemisiifolia]|uniref:U1-type domain-containing protein n=1 Tax=Ambrosia artemisiifolia TaxID=4212 RepID=A0AAD5BT96_AMBAR|nr:hypothetical protein M8C21_026456 [Ambrosia artemisiifolia]
MDAQAKKKALYRAKLKAQKQDKRIDHPLVRFRLLVVQTCSTGVWMEFVESGRSALMDARWVIWICWVWVPRYNESDQPVCKVCDIVLKSESAWSAHQISAKHREAINNLKANAAAANRVTNVKPGDSSELNKTKPEHPAETYKTQTKPPQAQSQSALPSDFFDKPERPAQSYKTQTKPPQSQSQSALPSDFFDKPETKTKQNVEWEGVDRLGINFKWTVDWEGVVSWLETSNAKLVDSDKNKKLGSVQAQVAYPFDGDNKRVQVSSGTVAETVGDETQAPQTRALPQGFFDDKDADLRARGITPVKPDIKDEYKEFEKLIQEDLKEVDNRLEEEEYDAAEMIEEAETVEQKSCRERVEMFKRKKMELKAARSAKRVKDPKVVEKESSVDESSSDEDIDDAVDWRAKHL